MMFAGRSGELKREEAPSGRDTRRRGGMRSSRVQTSGRGSSRVPEAMLRVVRHGCKNKGVGTSQRLGANEG